jgi:hypothetical protein
MLQDMMRGRKRSWRIAQPGGWSTPTWVSSECQIDAYACITLLTNERLWAVRNILSLEEPQSRSQWQRSLRHEASPPARTLGSWVRIHSRHGYLCAFICVVLCAGSGLTTGWFPVQGDLRTMHRSRNRKSAKVHKGSGAIDRYTEAPQNDKQLPFLRS